MAKNKQRRYVTERKSEFDSRSLNVEREEPENFSKKTGFVDYPEEHIIHSPTEKAIPEEKNPNVDAVTVVATTSVNFRMSPNMDATVINVAKKGDKFLLLNRLPNWVQVRTLDEPSTMGYLKSEFVEEL